MKWAYGVTTVASRIGTLLPSTLHSLKRAGFDKPRLFVDGVRATDWCGLEVTCRYPSVQVYKNWILSMWELWAREPHADRYAMFQDDIVCVANLKAHLERTTTQRDAYWNLYTFPENEGVTGWHLSNQRGRGALGLVFTRDVLRQLLASRHMVDKPMDSNRGWRTVDGAVVSALAAYKVREYVHSPSLLEHLGDYSTVRVGEPIHNSWKTTSFPGEVVWPPVSTT